MGITVVEILNGDDLGIKKCEYKYVDKICKNIRSKQPKMLEKHMK